MAEDGDDGTLGCRVNCDGNMNNWFVFVIMKVIMIINIIWSMDNTDVESRDRCGNVSTWFANETVVNLLVTLFIRIVMRTFTEA